MSSHSNPGFITSPTSTGPTQLPGIDDIIPPKGRKTDATKARRDAAQQLFDELARLQGVVADLTGNREELRRKLGVMDSRDAWDQVADAVRMDLVIMTGVEHMSCRRIYPGGTYTLTWTDTLGFSYKLMPQDRHLVVSHERVCRDRDVEVVRFGIDDTHLLALWVWMERVLDKKLEGRLPKRLEELFQRPVSFIPPYGEGLYPKTSLIATDLGRMALHGSLYEGKREM